jgi:LacI family transcriptional regulator
MMKKKLSIKDIASQLNVAKSTVSFILNGKAKEKRISDDLTKKVLQYVKEKGYKPSQLARSLSTGKTKMICLMVEKISDFFFSHIAFLLEQQAYKHGYKIIFCSTEDDPIKARELITMMRDRYVDGYIITPPSGIETEIGDLLDDQIPVVLFDRYFPELPTDYVVLNNFQGTYDAVEALAKSGCRHIAFVTLDSEQIQMQDRLDGYHQAIAGYGLKPTVLKIPFNKAEGVADDIKEFLRKRPNIDGVICATNYLAITSIPVFQELGLGFPDKISFIAFDDHDFFRIYTPSISAIGQPLTILAENLFNTLLEKLENKVEFTTLKQIVVPAELRLRASVKK